MLKPTFFQNRPLSFMLYVILCSISHFNLLPAQSETSDITQLSKIISIDSLKKHLAILGHDSLEGRATGTRGGDKAADYLSHQLAKYQLIPLGKNANYFQRIPMHGSIPTSESQLRLYTKNNQVHDFAEGVDYLLYKTGAQTFVPIPVPLVFVGFGIIAPEYEYNDYQSQDVRGKIVIFLEGEPASNDPEYFSGIHPTIYSLPESKQRIALSQGALGSLMIPISDSYSAMDWDKLKREFSFEDINLAYTISGHLSAIFHPEAASLLFKNSQLSLIQVRNLAARNKMRSFSLKNRLSFKGEFIERDFITSNVVGMISGSQDSWKDSYIIISAHYDHLGIGPAINNDSIYNGVGDNALGVAGTLELARVFRQFPQSFKRSLIFLFLTAEEKGLLGSTYYTDHPLLPLHKTIANLNIDGLAMNDLFLDVVGVGSELSTLDIFFREAARILNLKTASIPPEFAAWESFSCSDQMAFAQAGIPAMLTMDGPTLKNLTPQQAIAKSIYWMENIYHTPFDDLNQPINYEAARKHLQFNFLLISLLANKEQIPEWKQDLKYQKNRQQTQIEKR